MPCMWLKENKLIVIARNPKGDVAMTIYLPQHRFSHRITSFAIVLLAKQCQRVFFYDVESLLQTILLMERLERLYFRFVPSRVSLTRTGAMALNPAESPGKPGHSTMRFGINAQRRNCFRPASFSA